MLLLAGVLVGLCPGAGRAAWPWGDSSAVSNALVLGRAALEDGLYERAQKQFEACLRNAAARPEEKAESLALLAQALYGQGRYAELLKRLDEQPELLASNGAAGAAAFWRASALQELGQTPKALEILEEFGERHPADGYRPRALRLLAHALWSQERFDDALDAFETYDNEFGGEPDAPANRLEWARALLAVMRFPEARRLLEDLQALNLAGRTGLEVRQSLGQVLFGEKAWSQARQLIAPLMDRKDLPEDLLGSAVILAAQIEEAQTNYVEAVSRLDQGLAGVVSPLVRNELKLRKARLFLKLGKTDDGIALIRTFVGDQTTNSAAREIQLGLAQTLFDQGLYEKALTEYQNYVETFADAGGGARANLGKGWALYRLGRHVEAVAAFEKAHGLSADPADREQCLLKIADSHFAAGQYRTAMDAYGRVRAEYPGTAAAPQVDYQLGECLARLGQIGEAGALFAKLNETYPSHALADSALLRLADLKGREEKFAEAVGVYSHILKRTTDSAVRAGAIHGAGLIWYRQGRFDEALKHFQLVVQSLPGTAVTEQSFFMQGWCYYMTGEEEKARRVFDEFIRRYPESPWTPNIIFWIAEFDYNRGNPENAEKRFLRLAQDYPRSALADSALFWAGRSAFLQKEYRRANDRFNRLVKEYPRSAKLPDARLFQGESLCELGEFAGAILVFDEVIRQFPESDRVEQARFRKGDCQFTLGTGDPRRYEEAMLSYQAVLDRSGASANAQQQAEYKLGRCLEKLGRKAEAFEKYMNVVYAFFLAREKHVLGDETWFTRAAFNAAAIKEEEKSWRAVVNVYQRVVDAAVPAGPDAQERIRKIRLDHWLSFY